MLPIFLPLLPCCVCNTQVAYSLHAGSATLTHFSTSQTQLVMQDCSTFHDLTHAAQRKRSFAACSNAICACIGLGGQGHLLRLDTAVVSDLRHVSAIVRLGHNTAVTIVIVVFTGCAVCQHQHGCLFVHVLCRGCSQSKANYGKPLKPARRGWMPPSRSWADYATPLTLQAKTPILHSQRWASE